MSKFGLVAVCVAGLVTGCESSGNLRSQSDAGDDAGSATGSSTYAQVASVAKRIYDDANAGQDVSPHIGAVYEALGVPVLASDDTAGAQKRIKAGLPFATERLVQRMGEAYTQRTLVDVQGFADGLAEQKVGFASPLSQAAGLKNLLGSVVGGLGAAGQAQPYVPLEPQAVLPTLVWALGQERARRASTAGGVDPIWGDGQLDPLQFALLNATIFAKPALASGASASSTSSALSTTTEGLASRQKSNPAAAAIGDWIKDQLEGEVTSEVQGIVEVPLDKEDAAKVSICGSLILYGHKVSMSNTPWLLWRAPRTPNSTSVKMTLTFEDDYHDNWAHAVIGDGVKDLTGCTFPRKGPIEGKAVEWRISDTLEEQGNYDVTQQVTDASGNAVASWRTISGTVPQACQTLDHQHDATGATEAVVSGLLPGWSTVEALVTFFNPKTGGQGNANLTVQYYELNADDTCHLP